MNKKQALSKIKELQEFIQQLDAKQEWVKIDYNVVPKELFEKYGVKPFEIQKRKMRSADGEVWNSINYFNARKECEKLGGNLPNIQQMLLLLEHYKNTREKVSESDKEFLGIKELSYEEGVCFEWIYCLEDVAFRRGGGWSGGSNAGAFVLYLNNSPTNTSTCIGFRMCK